MNTNLGQLAAKYDKGVEDKARQWVSQVIGANLGEDLFRELKSGVVLCMWALTLLTVSRQVGQRYYARICWKVH